jgi:hypothetical protein
MDMETPIAKKQKVIWGREFHIFSTELERVLYDGWLIVHGTMIATIMPKSKESDGGERYLVIVEK